LYAGNAAMDIPKKRRTFLGIAAIVQYTGVVLSLRIHIDLGYVIIFRPCWHHSSDEGVVRALSSVLASSAITCGSGELRKRIR
jgi:hypothetical protein